MLKKGLHTVIIYFLISLHHFSLSAEPKVIGYYPHWLKSDLKPGQIDFENLTHIIHAFAWPNKDGTLTMYSGMIDPDLNYKVHLAGREILIALGGWGNSDAFSDVVADWVLGARAVGASSSSSGALSISPPACKCKRADRV